VQFFRYSVLPTNAPPASNTTFSTLIKFTYGIQGQVSLWLLKHTAPSYL